VRPGDRVVLTGIVRAEPEFTQAAKRLRVFRSRIEGNYVEPLGREPEEIQITKEDEEQILKIASQPNAYERLYQSIAPAIHGYETQKETILLQIIGAPQRVLPDGTTIRGDINVLLIGDPGCLVGDERVVLGDGAIVQIKDLGTYHLQRIDVSVLTGDGGKKAVATRFHVYKEQPIIEVITESGKSVKGTWNHPLLIAEDVNGKIRHRWKRLDEIKVGDRVVSVRKIPCTIRRYIPTGFKAARSQRPNFKERLPQKVTPELAQLLGYLIGKGCVREYGVEFMVSEADKDLLHRLLRLSYRLFGIKPSIVKKKPKGRSYKVTIRSQLIAENLRFLTEKRVPKLILLSGNKVASAFLKWVYEADGSLVRNRGWVSLKSKEVEFLRDVQMLLLRFGISSRIAQNSLIIGREDVVKFWKRVGFVSERKKKGLQELARAAKAIKRLHRQPYEQIVKIIHHEPADVYDVEVPKAQRFIANGLISHNTAKSELLKYTARIAPRGLYTSGRGSTAAGLTAAVVRERTGMMMLEAGAVVLADQGLACIDEFDKMRPEDRSALHECMEQQTCSVAKGGIVATLNARTAILAALNPILGKYDPYRNIADNVNIPIPLLTRFDLIFVLRDVPDRASDEKLARHIIEIHKKGTYATAPPIDFTLLRKYITYAKKINPVLTKEAEERLLEYYLQMRSMGSDMMITVTPRQLESLIRLATARARALLRDKVTEEDALRAISLMKRMLETVGVDVKTGRVDVGVFHGRPLSERNLLETAIDVFKSLEGPEKKPVEERAFIEALIDTKKFTQEDARRMLEILKRSGQIYEVKPGYYRKL
ncbi:MAG: LAGLIDADG family homing endonuclease, partial [Nitrososphaerota archaeon]